MQRSPGTYQTTYFGVALFFFILVDMVTRFISYVRNFLCVIFLQRCHPDVIPMSSSNQRTGSSVGGLL